VKALVKGLHHKARQHFRYVYGLVSRP
jgi:hypothetical protein